MQWHRSIKQATRRLGGILDADVRRVETGIREGTHQVAWIALVRGHDDRGATFLGNGRQPGQLRAGGSQRLEDLHHSFADVRNGYDDPRPGPASPEELQKSVEDVAFGNNAGELA